MRAACVAHRDDKAYHRRRGPDDPRDHDGAPEGFKQGMTADLGASGSAMLGQIPPWISGTKQSSQSVGSLRGGWGMSASIRTETTDLRTKATIGVSGLKVAVPLAADVLPGALVAMDGPSGGPTIELVLEGSALTALAKINGKCYRKMLEPIAEPGAADVAVVLQRVLRPPAAGSLEMAGFRVHVKTPRPAESAGEPTES